MGNLQIKDVPTELHAELRRRAAQRGMTQRDYVLELLRRDQALPTWEDWLAARRQRESVALDRPAAEWVREEREERTRELARRTETGDAGP